MKTALPLEAASVPVIAADGGGTRCRIAFANAHIVEQVEVAACNLSSDFDGGIRELRRGLDLLSQVLGEDLNQFPAVFALAGVVSDDIANRAARTFPFARIRVCEDRVAALRGALGGVDGAVIHAGTGAFVGVQAEGRARFAGGWGSNLGDEGSGFWIGREALRHHLRVLEKRADKGELSSAIQSEIGGAAEVIAYAGTRPVRDIADLAPRVVACAKTDPSAQEILMNAARHLSDYMQGMEEADHGPICLTGGVAPHLAAYLPTHIQKRLTQPRGTPLAGAIALARDLAGQS
ncbi:Glucosamine kinase GspK [Roseivivax sp. THAF40]|nr:Glucosamine kinase GspK [Roseivivax sp. THAF197b]QFT46263.1 Glucosamine kinase GspK [Roseivivax sp. THAF40]